MRSRFDKPGAMAIAAEYWGREYEIVQPTEPEPAQPGGVAVVTVLGPLTHRGDWFCGGDTYDGIEQRVAAALATSADCVVLKIDSPGGEVNGVFECARSLRKMADAASKRLVAYVDEFAGSAAYAIACACHKIYLPQAAQLGSIGVIDVIVDATAANAQAGLNIAVITSGSHKADGNPNVALTDEVRATVKATVDQLAGLFFGLVGEFRAMDPVAVQGLNAAMYRGPTAVENGLADGVMNWEQLLAMVASGEDTAQPEAGGSEDKMKLTKATVGALIAMLMGESPADPDPEQDAEVTPEEAKKMLAAIFASEEEEPAKEESAAETEEEPKKEEAKTESEEPKKDEDPAMKALAMAQAAKAEAAQLRAELKSRDEAIERTKLLATRPDLDAKVRQMLEGRPLAYVRDALTLIPKPAAAAAASEVGGTLGAGQGEPQSVNHDLDIRMGITQPKAEIRREGNDMIFPVLTPEQAREIAAKKAGV